MRTPLAIVVSLATTVLSVTLESNVALMNEAWSNPLSLATLDVLSQLLPQTEQSEIIHKEPDQIINDKTSTLAQVDKSDTTSTQAQKVKQMLDNIQLVTKLKPLPTTKPASILPQIDHTVIGEVTGDIGDQFSDSSRAGLWWNTDTPATEIADEVQDIRMVPAGIEPDVYGDYLKDFAVEATYLTDTEAELKGVDVLSGIKENPQKLLNALF